MLSAFVLSLVLSADFNVSRVSAMQSLFQPVPPGLMLDPDDGFGRLFDARAEAIVREATHLEVLRFRSDAKLAFLTAQAMAGERQVAGFAVDYSVLPASRKLLEDARALVLSRDVYAFYDGAKMCGGFQPKVGLSSGVLDR